MTVGLATVQYANGTLNVIRGGGVGVTLTAPAVMALKLHLGDPGAAGTANPSTNTTRQARTLAAAAAGAIALSSSPTWSSWANGNETLTHLSDWDSTTAGNFWLSYLLAVAKAVQNGDTLTVTSLNVSLAPLAA